MGNLRSNKTDEEWKELINSPDLSVIKANIVDFNNRISELKEIQKDDLDAPITTFVEISFNKNQLEVLGNVFGGWNKEDSINYFKNKVNLNLCLMKSRFTTREDQPDFQYLIDLGIKALESGMRLDEK